MATQKITMGRGRDTDYESKRAAALAQADYQNGYMWGQQEAYDDFGQMTSASRSPKYGNPNMLAKEATPQVDSNFNQDMGIGQQEHTGMLGQYSSTMNPHANPEMMGDQAEMRIQDLANGRQFQGHNNRQQIYGA